MEETQEPSRSIKTVDRAFTIIDTLDELGGAKLTDLARELDMPTSTAHTYLQTLVETGYVAREDDVYSTGLKFLKHGGQARHQMRLHTVGRSQVDQVAQQTAEVASLGIEDRGKRVLLYKSEGPNAVYDNAPVGEYTKMHWSALGKAILSQLNADRVSEIIETYGLPKRTENTITTPETLREELERTTRRGYSIENEERRVGVSSVGVPITDAEDELIGAMSVSGPANRFSKDWIEAETLPILNDAVNVTELRYVHD